MDNPLLMLNRLGYTIIFFIKHIVYLSLSGTSGLLLHPGTTGGFEGITQLLQLCNDSSKLGQKLLDALSSFSTANIDVNPKSKFVIHCIFHSKKNSSVDLY